MGDPSREAGRCAGSAQGGTEASLEDPKGARPEAAQDCEAGDLAAGASFRAEC